MTEAVLRQMDIRERTLVAGIPAVIEPENGPRRGTVILLHGLGGSADFMIDHYGHLVEVGLRLAALDAPDHGSRFDQQSKQHMARGITTFFYRTILDHLPEVQRVLQSVQEPAAVVGFSMGAFAVHALVSRSAPARAAVAHSGCACWLERERRRNSRMPADLTRAVERHEPRANRADRLETPLLTTHGQHDRTVAPELARIDRRELAAAYRSTPDRYVCRWQSDPTHALPADAVQAGMDWITRWLADTAG